MRIIGIVQARTSSVRCPGKMLRPMYGRPMIDWVLDALRRSEAARVIAGVALATSVEPNDDVLAAHVSSLGIRVHRGPLNDVACRMLEAAEALHCDAFVRISGDSPLLDTTLVIQAAELFRAGGFDLVSNVAVRSFPKGQSVEVVGRIAMRDALAHMTSAGDREHVTPYFYRNSDRFRIRSVVADDPMPRLQMSVDTPVDFERCEAVIAACRGDIAGLGWRRLAALCQAQETGA